MSNRNRGRRMLDLMAEGFYGAWRPGRAAGRGRRRALALPPPMVFEALENRLLLSSVSFDSVDPTPIPIGAVKAGQTINLSVNYATTDNQEGFEGEPLVLVPSAGKAITIAAFGQQTIALPIGMDGETLSGYVVGADGDELATVSTVPSGSLLINDSATTADNITLFNPPTAPMAFVQTIPAQVINTSSTTETFQLSVKKMGTGNVSLSQSSVTLASGASTDVIVTPTADSSVANDVQIIAMDDGKQVAQDIMTVVSVQIRKDIYNPDTPDAMVTGGSFRIPPRINTPNPVQVTPGLAGTGESVTLLVAGQGGGNGSVTIDNAPTEELTGTTITQLSSPDGTTQTMPSHSASLYLTVAVRSQNTIQSTGFSVSAIPINYTDTFVRNLTSDDVGKGIEPVVGFLVQDGWSSDSTVFADLDKTKISELVDTSGTGMFEAVHTSTNSGYFIGTHLTRDHHIVSVSAITRLAQITELDSGVMTFMQVCEFIDLRTGAMDIPMTNSGFLITFTDNKVLGTLVNTATKVGANVTAKGLSSMAGACDVSATQIVARLPSVKRAGTPALTEAAKSAPALAEAAKSATSVPPAATPHAESDPLVFTTQPPATVTAGQGFTVVVTAENGDGTTNTSFTDPVYLYSNDGSLLSGQSPLTATAVAGVATFTNVSETFPTQDSLLAYTTSLPEVSSNEFTIIPGPVSQLAITAPSGYLLVNSATSILVDAEDSVGNLISTFNGNVTLSLGANPGGATLGGTLTVAAVNGVATFTPISINKAGIGYTFSAASAGLTTGVTAAFNVTDQLVVTTPPPAQVTAGTPYGLVVTAEDGLGNIDTTFTGSVTVASLYGSTLNGTATVTAVGGVATFSGLSETRAGSEVLSVASGVLPQSATGFFSIAAATATHLVFDGPNPSGQDNSISSPFGFDLDAEDQFGNIDSSFNGNVTVALLSNPSGATLGGSLTVQASGGDAGFDSMTIDKLGTGYTIQATSPGLTSAISVSFNVTDQVGIITPPPTTLVAGVPFTLVVAAEAGLGNVDTTYNGTMTLQLSNFSGGTGIFTLGGTLSAPAINGVATFNGLTEDVAATFEILVNGPGLTSSGVDFTVSAAPATQLVIVKQPAVSSTGFAFEVDTDAEDPFGNVDTTFTGNVNLALLNNPASDTLGGTTSIAATAGVVQFPGMVLQNAATGVTLQATAAGLAPAITVPMNITPRGVANQLQIINDLEEVTAGGIPSLTIVAEDSFGAADGSFDGLVTIALGANPTGAVLNGVLTAQANEGFAEFNGLSVDAAASGYTLVVTSGSLVPGTSLPFAVAAAPATSLVVSPPIGNVLVGGAFNLLVTAVDPFGNIDPSFGGSVTLAMGANAANAALGGTLSVAAAGGVAYFTGLTLDQPGTGFTIQANGSNGGPALAVGTSPTFNVVTDQLAVTTDPPLIITAGNPFGVAVTAQGSTGTTDSSFNAPVTVSLVSFEGGNPTLTGTLTVNAVNGVATFSGLGLTEPGSYVLAFNSTGLAGTVTDFLTVTSLPTQLAVAAQPPAAVTAGTPFSTSVAVEDAFGNVDGAFNGTVTLALATNPAGGVLSGTLTALAFNGIATFSGLSINNAGSGYSLQATASGLASAITQAFNVTGAGIPTQLLVTTAPPPNTTAGSAFGLIVQAQDSSGALATGFSGNVTVVLNNYSANPLAALGGTLTVAAVNGVATFSGLTLTQAGEYSLSVVSNALPPVTTAIINVASLAASQLVIQPLPSGLLAGAPFTATVDAEDAFGNVIPTFNGSVSLLLGGGTPGAGAALGGTVTVTAVNGVATFAGLTINLPGTGYTLDATGGGLTAGLSPLFDLTTDKLVVSTQPAALVAAGSPFGFVVSAQNAAGSVDTSFNGNVTIDFQSGGGDVPVSTLGGTLTVPAVNGVATFTGLTLTPPGVYALSVISAGLAGVTTNFFTVSGVATQLVVTTPPPAAVTVGAGFGLQLTTEDAFGNLDTTFDGSVTISLAANPGGPGSTLGGTLTAIASNGVVTFSGLTLNHLGAGYTLMAATSGLTSATTSAINVTALGVANQLVVTTQPPATIVNGADFGMIVKAEDSFGTVDSFFSGSLTVDDGTGPTPGGPLTVAAVHGVATFSGLTLDQAGSYVLSVSGGGLAGASTSPFNVSAAAATQLAVEGPTGDILPGVLFNLDVAAVDGNGNVDTGFVGSVTIALSTNPGSATFGGTLTVSAVNGVASFTGLTINAPGTGYVIQATANGLTTATSSSFDVTTDHLVVTTQPQAAIPVGAGFGLGLAVAAENASGVIDTSFTGSVTASLNTAFGNDAANLGGTLTVTAVNGVATFSGLTVDQTGDYSLLLTTGGVGAATSNDFNVTTAAPSNITATGATLNVTAGQAFTAPVVTFTDSDSGAFPAGFNATIGWGDGTSSPGTISQPGGVGTSFSVTGTHTYGAHGAAPISVSISGIDGSAATGHATANIAASPVPNDSTLFGPMAVEGIDDAGSIVTDGIGDITSGSLALNSGATSTVTGTSYSISGSGVVSVSIGGSGGFSFNGSGAIDSTGDLAALTNASLAAGADSGLTVLVSPGSATFSDLNAAGVWSVISTKGRGTVTLDGAGHVLSGKILTKSNPTGLNVTGGTYSISVGGAVILTLETSASTLPLAGQMDASGDTISLDDAVPGTANGVGLVMLEKASASSNLGDGVGTWTITGNGMAGSITLDGKGKIAGGSVTLLGSATPAAASGTYTLSKGALGLSLTLTPAGSHPTAQKFTLLGTLNASGNIASLDNSTISGSPANMVILISSASTLPSIGSLTTNGPVKKGTPLVLTANNVSVGGPDQIQSVTFYADTLGTGVFNATKDKVVGMAKLTTAGTWSLSLVTTALPVGSTRFFARATDKFGRFSRVPTLSTVILDTPPVIGKLGVTGAVAAGSTITLAATGVGDPFNKVASVSFYWDPTGTGSLTHAVLLGSTTSTTWKLTHALPAANDPTHPFPTTGTATFLAVATDASGTVQATPTALTVPVDAPPSLASLTAPASVVRGASVTLTASGAADPDGTVAKVMFYLGKIGDTTLNLATATLLGTATKAGTGGNFTFLYKVPPTLAAGTYPLFAVAVDNLGAQSAGVMTTLLVEV